MRVLGIDEAGRGCVFGSLVVAAFVVEGVEPEVLRAAGADDSKKLSPPKRLIAREKLAKLGTADVRQITADDIDQGNLNTLEEDTIAALIRQHEPDFVYIDALGPPRGIPKVIDRLQAQVGSHRPKWVMEPKADGTYPVVGAASIFAKTTRDGLLEDLAEEFGALGSGYPGDPATKAWLVQWAATKRPWPSFVRTRWATIQQLGQQSLF